MITLGQVLSNTIRDRFCNPGGEKCNQPYREPVFATINSEKRSDALQGATFRESKEIFCQKSCDFL